MDDKIKQLQEFVDNKWDNVKALDKCMEMEKEYNGRVSVQTKKYKDLAIARWATADKILQFMLGNEENLIEVKKDDN